MEKIIHNITISAPLEKVFYAVSTEKGFKGWWAQDTEAQGDNFIFSFSNKQYIAKFKVVKKRENKLIRMDAFEGMTEQWAESYLLFELEENDGNTILTFTHGNWKEQNQEYAMCNTNWGKLMFHLKSFAETGNPNPMM